MKLLAIDTSTMCCSVALLQGDEITSSHVVAPMQQTQLILPMIEEILQKANITLNDLDAMAFGRGPGSFTGVRIATSVMQGLAFAIHCPLIPVSSLAAIAQDTFQEKGWRKILVAIDARMGEIYWGAYQVNQAGLVELAGKEEVCRPEHLAVEGDDWYGAGDAWQVYADLLSLKTIAIAPDQQAKASAITVLAKEQFQQKSWVSAAEATPVYLRDNVAIKSNPSHK
jgi:tRNA threonylcarbamoyladenosine biosynthesis protein TsaB